VIQPKISRYFVALSAHSRSHICVHTFEITSGVRVQAGHWRTYTPDDVEVAVAMRKKTASHRDDARVGPTLSRA
jgi:hypothetical protein